MTPIFFSLPESASSLRMEEVCSSRPWRKRFRKSLRINPGGVPPGTLSGFSDPIGGNPGTGGSPFRREGGKNI